MVQGVTAANQAVTSTQDKMKANNTTGQVVAGAAAVGCVAGFALVGPMTAVAAGVAVGGAAAVSSDAPGQMARAAGGASVSAYKKAKEIDDKYHVVEKTKKAATSAYASAKEFNNKYQVTERSKAAASDAYKKACRMDEKYNISGQAAAGITSGFNYLSSALGGSTTTPAVKTEPPSMRAQVDPPPPEYTAVAPPAPPDVHVRSMGFVVPEGAVSGSVLNVQAPDGNLVQVTIPPNAPPGTTLQVDY